MNYKIPNTTLPYRSSYLLNSCYKIKKGAAENIFNYKYKGYGLGNG